MEEVVIVSAARTPIGSFGGSLKNCNAVELGKTATEAALNRAGLSPDEVDSVIFGNVLQAGIGGEAAARGEGAAGRKVGQVGRRAGDGLLKYDLARHDKAAGLLAAFRKALLKYKLVGALSG